MGDLRMLTQADAGELPLTPQKIAPGRTVAAGGGSLSASRRTAKVTLEVKTPPGLPEIMVDDPRMMQVMDNLLSNALRYTPDAGLEITPVSARLAKGKVLLEVRDTGSRDSRR